MLEDKIRWDGKLAAQELKALGLQPTRVEITSAQQLASLTPSPSAVYFLSDAAARELQSKNLLGVANVLSRAGRVVPFGPEAENFLERYVPKPAAPNVPPAGPPAFHTPPQQSRPSGRFAPPTAAPSVQHYQIPPPSVPSPGQSGRILAQPAAPIQAEPAVPTINTSPPVAAYQPGGTMAAPPPSDLEDRVGSESMPTKIGPYQILGELGRGAMGVVYKGSHAGMRRLAAIKVLQPQWANDEETRARFVREGQIPAHPNLVPVYETGEDAGRPYLAMQFVEGDTLTKTLTRVESVDDRVEILRQVALGLEAAHQNNFVHRDLKPDNVMVKREVRRDEQGETRQVFTPVVMDFGVARDLGVNQGMTQTGQLMGTPMYMSPEQFNGQHVDARSDIWSLGVILYEALTGKKPFEGHSLTDLGNKIFSHEPIAPRKHNPGAPKDLETITLKCLEKEPAKRYQTALELAEDLGRYAEDESISARPIGRIERLYRKAKRNRAASLAIAGVTAVILAAAGVIVQQRYQAAADREAQVRTLLSQAAEQTTAGHYEEAQAMYNRVLGIAPTNSDAIGGLRNLDRARAEVGFRSLEAEVHRLVAEARSDAQWTAVQAKMEVLERQRGEWNLEYTTLTETDSDLIGGTTFLEVRVPQNAGNMYMQGVVFDSAGRMNIAPEQTPVSPGRVVQPAGDYVLTVQANDTYAEAKFPLRLRRRTAEDLNDPNLERSLDVVLVQRRAIPEGFVYVPGGTAVLYNERGERREVTVSPFAMAQTEVTLQQFSDYLRELTPTERANFLPRYQLPNQSGTFSFFNDDGTLRSTVVDRRTNADGSVREIEYPINPEWPVFSLTWRQANAYAERRGYALPGREQQAFVAGNGELDTMFPGGNNFDPTLYNAGVLPEERGTKNWGTFYIPASASRPAGIYGVRELVGNVWEWSSEQLPGNDGALLGGAWSTGAARSSNQAAPLMAHRGTSNTDIGARVVTTLGEGVLVSPVQPEPR